MSFEAEANFCLNFLKTLDDKKSSVYSPASLLNALAMIYAGSGGKTAEELSKIIGKDQSKVEIIEYYSNFVKRHKSVVDGKDADLLYLPPPEKKRKKDGGSEDEAAAENANCKDESDSNNEDVNAKDEAEDEEDSFDEEEDPTPSSKVILANRILLNEKIEVKKEFEKIVKENFANNIQKVDFNDENEAEKIINNFVNKATHGMIKEVIESSDISPQTSLILINVIYFIGKWETTFLFKFKEKFYASEIREIQFMKSATLDRWFYNEAKEWESVGIPYRERQCWMFIILPKEKNGLENLIKKFDYSMFVEATKGTNSGRIEVTMPMFEISGSYDLQDSLPKLGLNNIFTNPDLSEMLNGPHKIDKAIHKAMIQVDEYGTVASAVTSSTMVARCGSCKHKIVINHPFLYFIVSLKDQNLTEILFAGKFC